MRRIDVPRGTRFGRLTVIREAQKRGEKRTFECQCDCGAFAVADLGKLRTGHTASCGCLRVMDIGLRNSARATHGHKLKGNASPTYRSWRGMKTRCTHPNHKFWKYYGGRGITICKRWLNSFENFLADMGVRPDGTTLERTNNDGNYEPGNCRWATPKEQAQNRRAPK